MQSSIHPSSNLYISLGERRGRSDLATSLDLSWAREASESVYSRVYPSPPMSGSPPLPPRSNPESSSRELGSYVSTGPASQQKYQERGMGLPVQNFPERPPQASYAPYIPEDMTEQINFQHPPQHHQHHQQSQPHQQHHQHHQQHRLQAPLQQPVQHMYAPQGPPPFSPSRPQVEPTSFSPSKAQRKTKGHVASACVPCKRAHLRCDAQRPCSRCLANGKEDACVDVQHKKRGRPRLRDEREPRYEVLGPNYPPPPENIARRPLLIYGDAPYSTFGDPQQRPGAYRVLKSQSGVGGPTSPRHMEHALSTIDTYNYAPSVPSTPRMFAPQEPICAYLNMEMQIAKASNGFSETIGVQSVVSRRLQDIVSVSDRDKVSRLQELLEEEKREREPNYLPPIYLKIEEDRLIQSISFTPEDMAQFRLDRQERITFQGPDGQQRAFQVRIGLAKKESTYFVVLLLDLPMTPQPYIPPSYSREAQYGFIPSPQTPNPIASPYMVNPSFGTHRGEMATYRTPGHMGSAIPPSMNMPTFTQTPIRQDYSQTQNPYQSPRTEQPQSQALPQPHLQQQQQQPLPQGHNLQLPPILPQHREGPPADPAAQRRDDRSSRVDIGGLLERQDHAGRSR